MAGGTGGSSAPLCPIFSSSRRDVHVVLLVNYSYRMRDASVLSLARLKAMATGFRFPRCQGPGVPGSLGKNVQRMCVCVFVRCVRMCGRSQHQASLFNSRSSCSWLCPFLLSLAACSCPSSCRAPTPPALTCTAWTLCPPAGRPTRLSMATRSVFGQLCG